MHSPQPFFTILLKIDDSVTRVAILFETKGTDWGKFTDTVHEHIKEYPTPAFQETHHNNQYA